MTINNKQHFPKGTVTTPISVKFAANDTPSTVPVFKSKRGIKHIPYTDNSNGGKEDGYPIELLQYKGSSSWHGAILKYIIDQISGTGFEPLIDNTEFDEKTADFLADLNGKGDSANVLLEKWAFDKAVFNGVTSIDTWSAKWDMIKSVDHVAFSNIRCAPVNEFGEIDTFFYCWDWTQKKYLKQEIPAFSLSSIKTKAEEVAAALENDDTEKIVRIKNEVNSQLSRSIPYSPDNIYYPLPAYVACLSPIRADIHSDIFGENILKNGLSAGVHVNLVGTYSDDEKAIEVENLQYNYTGSKNAGIPFVTFSTTKEAAVSVTPLKLDAKEDRYKAVNEATQQKILSGHRVTSPLLMGIALAGTLGNRDELETAYNVFQKTVIQPMQSNIVAWLNVKLKRNGMQLVKIGQLTLFDAIEEKETSEITE